MAKPGESYFSVLTRAMADVSERGYQSPEQIEMWSAELRKAAERSMRSIKDVERMVRDGMAAIFRRQVENGGVLRLNPGVKAYTIERVRPELHAELSRRIAASIDLIKLDREQSIQKMEQRFRGWSTSVPAGGSDTVERREEKTRVRKSLASLPYHERFVIGDQGHKLVAAINSTVAVNGGAIGAIWNSHKFERGYNGRPAHNARDDKFFLVKGSWADLAGYVKPDKYEYTDNVEQPAFLPHCRCFWRFQYSLRSIPPECLTEKGKEALAEARKKAVLCSKRRNQKRGLIPREFSA